MRFVLVNGRTPCAQSFCALCREPIGASYLREIGTELSYCDHDCYADHCKEAALALEHHARSSRIILALWSDKAVGLGTTRSKSDPRV
jgi:hypothetical protein